MAFRDGKPTCVLCGTGGGGGGGLEPGDGSLWPLGSIPYGGAGGALFASTGVLAPSGTHLQFDEITAPALAADTVQVFGEDLSGDTTLVFQGPTTGHRLVYQDDQTADLETGYSLYLEDDVSATDGAAMGYKTSDNVAMFGHKLRVDNSINGSFVTGAVAVAQTSAFTWIQSANSIFFTNAGINTAEMSSVYIRHLKPSEFTVIGGILPVIDVFQSGQREHAYADWPFVHIAPGFSNSIRAGGTNDYIQVNGGNNPAALPAFRLTQIIAPTDFRGQGVNTVVTNASMLYVDSAIPEGVNMTITNNYAIEVGSGLSHFPGIEMPEIATSPASKALSVFNFVEDDGAFDTRMVWRGEDTEMAWYQDRPNAAGGGYMLTMRRNTDQQGAAFGIRNGEFALFGNQRFVQNDIDSLTLTAGMVQSASFTWFSAANTLFFRAAGNGVFEVNSTRATFVRPLRVYRNQSTGTPRVEIFRGTVTTFGGELNHFLVGAGMSDIGVNQTIDFVSADVVALMRLNQFIAPVDFSAPGASTITEGATVYIDKGVVAGTNMTVTNSYSLWCDADLARLDDGVEMPSHTVSGAKTGSVFIGFDGDFKIQMPTTLVTFADTPPSVTGSRGGNAAVASLLSALATAGIVTDNTTA